MNSNRYGRSWKLLPVCAIAAPALLLPSIAGAQTSPTDETIIVTGTRATDRTKLNTPAPVDVLTGKDLDKSGAVAGELGQAIANLAPSFNFPRQSNSGTSDHIRAGQLRGMSPDQTLVLVNGRRRNVSAVVNTETKIGRGTAAVDLNTIPLSAVKRVEILRDGAGAQYGSDAIAGVINVILDDEPRGFKASATYGFHATRLEPVQRNITDGETATLTASGATPLGSNGGFLRLGGEFVSRQPTNRAGFDQIPFFVPQTPANLAFRGRRNYAEGDPDTRGGGAWFNAAVPAGPVEIYAFGTASGRRTQGATFFRYPDSSSNVPEIYPDGFLPRTIGHDLNIWSSGGARGQIGAWAFDGGVTYGRDRFAYGVDNSLNASLGPSSPTHFRSGRFTFEQLISNLELRRDLPAAFTHSPVTVTLGAEYRREHFSSGAGDPASFAVGPFDLEAGAQGAPGLTPADEERISRNVYSLYGDITSNVTGRLFVDVAGRFESYSDVGHKLTAKASAIYSFSRALSFRASVSNNVRAPALGQVAFSDRTVNFGTDRTRVLTRTLPVSSALARILGATPLKPETSLNVTGGLTGSLARGLSFTVDAFNIKVSDRITLSDRLFGPALAAFVQSQPGGEHVEAVRFFTNAADTRTRGLDAVLDYRRQWHGGQIGLNAAFSYSRTRITHLAPTPAALESIDPTLLIVGPEEINTITEAAPRTKLVTSAEWARGPFDILLRLSRFGSAVRVFNFGGGFIPRQRYGAEWSLDAHAEYQLTSRLILSAGGTNLGDNYPDRSSPDINFFGNLPYDILSPIGVNGRFLYAGLQVRL